MTPRKLVDVMGCESGMWSKRWVADKWRFNPLRRFRMYMVMSKYSDAKTKTARQERCGVVRMDHQANMTARCFVKSACLRSVIEPASTLRLRGTKSYMKEDKCVRDNLGRY